MSVQQSSMTLVWRKVASMCIVPGLGSLASCASEIVGAVPNLRLSRQSEQQTLGVPLFLGASRQELDAVVASSATSTPACTSATTPGKDVADAHSCPPLLELSELAGGQLASQQQLAVPMTQLHVTTEPISAQACNVHTSVWEAYTGGMAATHYTSLPLGTTMPTWHSGTSTWALRFL